MQQNNDIQDACRVIRHWNEVFADSKGPVEPPDGLVEAVATLKRYLEGEKADGRPIRELEVADYLLTTPEGVRWVMPFVLSAESREFHKHGKAFG